MLISFGCLNFKSIPLIILFYIIALILMNLEEREICSAAISAILLRHKKISIDVIPN